MTSEIIPPTCDTWTTTNREFFEKMYAGIDLTDGPKFIEHRKIDQEGKCRSEFHGSIDSLLEARKEQKKGVDYYFGAHLRDSPDGTRSAVSVVTTLHADLDYKTHTHVEWTKILNDLKDQQIPATVVVFTGHGLHGYWFLEKPLHLADDKAKDHFESVQRGLQQALGADSTHDLPRILRVPTTTNYKSLEKPVQTEILFADYERVYRLAQFAKFTPADNPPASQGPAPAVEDEIIAGGRNRALASLAGSIRRPGMTVEEIEAALLVANKKRCKPPLPEAEIHKIAESIGKYTPAEQRSSPTAEVEKWDKPTPWPELAPEAYYGLAGNLVKMIEPHSEADPAALLVQIIVAVGNIVGRGPHCKAEADTHHLNLFATLVGETSKARKGTSWGYVTANFDQVDSRWSNRIHTGLSSGEGLIWAARDPVEELKRVKSKKDSTSQYETVVTDPGIVDKRLVVFEGEFAKTLRVMGREGNTLSAVLRDAWDGRRLEMLVKHSKNRATAAHISVISHITRSELLRYLDSTEAGNGFGNRFLWLCVRRSKLLPEGGNLDPDDLRPLISELREVVTWSHNVGELRRDEKARSTWYEVYPTLSAGKPGLLGAMIARAEAQVMRLSCIYALLDQSTIIREEHILAALALWDYCEQSARYIFSDKLGDPVADTILKTARQSPQGLTRTQISNLFRRHQSQARIANALNLLVEQQLLKGVTERDTGGRPAERFIADSYCEISEISEISTPNTPKQGVNSLNSLISHSSKE